MSNSIRRMLRGARASRFAIVLAAVAVVATLSSCGGLAFTVANVPALSGEFERRANLVYGPTEGQRLDLYLPLRTAAAAGPRVTAAAADSAAAQVRPIIIFWYGGAWTRGSRSQYRFVGAALAEAGYMAVLPDYRLYPSVRYPAFIEDGAAAVRWVRDRAREFGGDPDRIFLMGHSAGAHLAASLAWQPRWLQAAGVPRSAVRGLIGLSGPYALEPNTRTLNAIFAAPYGPDDWQPIRDIARGAPPALLLHGAEDRLVWPRNATAAAAALRDVGVSGAARLYEDRSHADTVAALSVPGRNRAPVLADLRRFVDATLSARGGP
jgi:acetyl esterase/lipase